MTASGVLHGSAHDALWGIWAVYWLWAARGAKPVLRRETWASRLSHIAPLAAAIWLLASAGFPGTLLNRHVLPPAPGVFWAGTVLLLVGLGYAVVARRVLGGNWSGIVTLKEGHELIRSGPYRITRHPIYTGLLLALAGSALALDQWRGVLAVTLVALAFRRKIKVEEALLSTIFARDYEDYRAAVPALLPGAGSWRRRS